MFTRPYLGVRGKPLFTFRRGCPACGFSELRRSRRLTFSEKVIGIFALPYRCVDCDVRFFQFRPPKLADLWEVFSSAPPRGRTASVVFAPSWRVIAAPTPRTTRASAVNTQRVQTSLPGIQARRILGVSSSAPLDEVSAAYHSLALLYHPDRVAALAPEIQALAGMRMREINAAYEVLKELDSPLS